jgi:serine/threonine protein kinase
MLKLVDIVEYPNEVDITTFLSSKDLANAPENHCVPILEVLKPQDDQRHVILVMPLLRACLNPPFETVGEVVEFLRQIFEVSFICLLSHDRVPIKLRTGHTFHARAPSCSSVCPSSLIWCFFYTFLSSDCHEPNILMNADDMYPGGFHAADPSMTPDWSGKAKHFSRTERPPKYYLIDFGISVRFSPDDSTPRTRVDAWGGDFDRPPEIEQVNAEYDPFPTDVYYMGNIIKHNFTEVRNTRNIVLPSVTYYFRAVSPLRSRRSWDSTS